MAVRIRTTEKHPHPIWEQFIAEFSVAEIQGFIFTSTDEELIAATRAGSKDIPIQCLEAAEYDLDEELSPESFFTNLDWLKKVNASAYFNSTLLFLTHKPKDEVLFRLHQVKVEDDKAEFTEINRFKDEESFIGWWKSIKKLAQSKKTVEAKSRQGETIFDDIIERSGSSWGGNMDGFVLTDDNNSVTAIIEVRQSRSFEIENYDPAKYFSGTFSKGGDFKTWLPMVYLKKAYKIPIVLITLSTKSGGKFGYTEVSTISTSKLYYTDDISPTKNVTDDFQKFKTWLNALINKK